MLPLTEFKKPLITFQGGAPPHYRRKYPPLYQTFPLPVKPMSRPRPRLLPENIRQYPYDAFGRRLYYIK